MNLFAVLPELKVGRIVEVAGDAIRIEIDATVSELTRTHGGDVYPIGQCGSVLKIHCGRRVLFAYVNVLRMRSEIAFQEGVPPPPPSEDSRMIEATIFAEGRWSESNQSLYLSRGVSTYPLPSQCAYLTTLGELSALYGPNQDTSVTKHRISLGSYSGASSSTCYADLDKLVGLHCAVLGSTGSGKSGTVAAILRSILETKRNDDTENTSNFRPRVVLIDPHGEYATAFKDRCVVFQAYSAASTENIQEKRETLRLPYWTMTGEEFRDLVIGKTEREATSENNIVLKALRHSRLVAKGLIEKARSNWSGQSVDGIVHPAEDRLIDSANETHKQLVGSYDHDTPDIFSLQELRTYIEHELGMREKTKKWESLSPSEFTSHASILDKLSVLQRDPRLTFMMDEESQTQGLAKIIQQFVGDLSNEGDAETKDIRIVDISGLPNEVAGPLTAMIARLIFQYKVWQTRQERECDPVMLVCEEAHRYVPNTGLAEYASAQKAIRRLAKEGRKYGIGLLLVSQRPADVEGTVLSQCNSWLVLRLTNTVDQDHVRRFLPDNLAGLSRLLPSLSRQEAIFVGDAASLPARIKIRTLTKNELPDSNDISFGDGWSQPPLSIKSIEQVVARWLRLKDVLEEQPSLLPEEVKAPIKKTRTEK